MNGPFFVASEARFESKEAYGKIKVKGRQVFNASVNFVTHPITVPVTYRPISMGDEKKDIPYFFVLDKSGKIKYATSGKFDDKKFEKILDVIEEN